MVAKHDKIRITNNCKATNGKHLFNGRVYKVDFDKQGNFKLPDGSILPKDFQHFTLGYVSTSHSAQGKTADKVIISQSSNTFKAASMEQFYVSVSRGKQAVSIYTDDKATLMQAVSQSTQRISATELLEKNKAAAEGNRVSVFTKMKDKERESIEKLKINKTNDIQGTSRAGFRKAK